MNAKQVELIDVSYHYSGQIALRTFSASFNKNQVTAIIGRSGSGKSTVLQLVNGLLRPSSGSVKIAGAHLNYNDLSKARLQIGYAVQGNGLFPHLTIDDNIQIAGKLSSWSKPDLDKRTDELLLLLGLPIVYKKKFPYELSGGEQQRVSIGRALFLNPPLLLMDEPFGALDPVTRAEMQQEILKIQKIEPRTILIVTHDMREAQKLADDIMVLHAGELQQFDTKERVIQSPANEDVLHLINASLS